MNTRKTTPNRFGKLVSFLLVTLVAGCAYVEYRRVYNIEPGLSAEQRTSIGAVIEHHFVDRGYVLKQKYRDYYPDEMYVSILEIPKTAGQKVRHPYLLVLVKSAGIVQLKHSEWFLDDSPFGESKNKPEDVVAVAKEELIAKLKKQLGITVDIQLFGKGPY